MKPHEICLVIQTTRGTDSFEFPTTTTVKDVIHEVRKHFDLTGGGQFALVRKGSGEQLRPDNDALVKFDLKDKDELVLTGGGVNV